MKISLDFFPPPLFLRIELKLLSALSHRIVEIEKYKELQKAGILIFRCRYWAPKRKWPAYLLELVLESSVCPHYPCTQDPRGPSHSCPKRSQSQNGCVSDKSSQTQTAWRVSELLPPHSLCNRSSVILARWGTSSGIQGKPRNTAAYFP